MRTSLLIRAAGIALLAVGGCGRSSLWSFTDFASLDDASVVADATEPRDAAFHVCVPGALGITKADPTVLFVLDRSGSMNFNFGPFGSRWLSLTHALSTALPATDSTVATGALLFPAGNNFSAACNVPTSASLVPALDNTAALISLMNATTPAGETPTSAALETAADILLGIRAATTARAVVLATDGAPNCNTALDPSSCTCATMNQSGTCSDATQCLDDVRTVSTVAGLLSRGLPTYVIGIADTSDAAFVNTLNAMAKAGGRPQTGASTLYYAATSDTDLQSALVQIANQVGACEYLISDVPTLGEVVITVDGMTVPFDPANGWSWRDQSNGQIQLNGTSCLAAAGTSNVIVSAAAVCNGDR